MRELEPTRELLQVFAATKSYPLTKHLFKRANRFIFPVREVSLTIYTQEIVGIAGESGSGKSTLLRLLAGLELADQGQIVLTGRKENFDLSHKLSRSGEKAFRQELQLIFQDPFESLNPKHRIDRILKEATALRAHHALPVASATTQMAWIEAALTAVGLPLSFLRRHPFQLSGGQRQRISIARALVMRPEVLLADEPVSALDVSVQAQILGYLLKLKQEHGFSLVVVSHDLAMLNSLCDRILIYYGGRILESTPAGELFMGHHHPYTQLLLQSAWLKTLKAEQAWDETGRPLEFSGCPFYFRCPYKSEACQSFPPFTTQGGRQIACHHLSQVPVGLGE